MSKQVDDGLERLGILSSKAISAVVGSKEDDGNDVMAKSPRKLDSCSSNVVTPAVKAERVAFRTKSEVDVLDDGHQWRQYGIKPVKRGHLKSYYQCTYARCAVRKQIERDSDNPEFVITTYEGIHNHNFVTPAAKTSIHGSSGSVVDGDSFCISSDNRGITSLDRGAEPDLGVPGKSETTTEEEEYGHNDTSRRCYRFMGSRSSDVTPAVKPSVVTVRTKSKVDVVDDGYRWRKYGSKSVLGSPHLRSYYRCTHAGCRARKTVCRDSDDPQFVTTTVRDAHNHVSVADRKESSCISSLDLGANMSSNTARTGCNENFGSMHMSDSLRFDITTSLDLGIGMDFFAIDDFNDSFYSFPESGMSITSGNGKGNAIPPPASDLMWSGEKHDTMALDLHHQQELGKLQGGTLDIAEKQMQFQIPLASLENEPYHCDVMYRKELYLSKSPLSSYFFSAQYFVSIFLPYYKHQQLWKGGEQLLVNLKHLDLKHSALHWIPDISKSQKLEDLNLEECINLVGISSIQHLTKLQHLNLKGCQSLRGLPSLMKLKFLKTLNLSHCSNLMRLPPSLGCIPSLCELNLRNCAKLNSLPRSIINLMTSLETLNISGCSSLWEPNAEIPMSQSSDDVSLDPPQLFTLVQVETAGPSASAVDSPSSKDPSLESWDIRREKTIEWEEYNAFTREKKTIVAINDTGSNGLEVEQSNKGDGLPKEDRQQSFDDEEHEDAGSAGKKPQKIAEETTFVFCQVEDCGVDLSSEKTYHQRVKTCQVHCNASTALVGKFMQRFCQQCSGFHLIEEFDEEKRICRSRSAGCHQKHSRQSSTSTGTDSEEKFLLLKRTRMSDNAIPKTIKPLEDYLSMSLKDLEEANALGNIEHAVLAMIEQSSSSDDRATLENVLVCLAEWKQGVPQTLMSMQNAEAESAIAAGEMRKMDARLTRGELHLSLLDLELSLISEEEEQIEAEIQRLMDEKRQLLRA